MHAVFVIDSPPLLVLFAYGSLKRGQANARELANARYLGPARTEAVFALRMIDGYPALVPGERAIEGELYQISREQLSALDEFEGDGYVRAEIALAGGARALSYLARVPEAGSVFEGYAWPARGET